MKINGTFTIILLVLQEWLMSVNEKGCWFKPGFPRGTVLHLLSCVRAYEWVSAAFYVETIENKSIFRIQPIYQYNNDHNLSIILFLLNFHEAQNRNGVNAGFLQHVLMKPGVVECFVSAVERCGEKKKRRRGVAGSSGRVSPCVCVFVCFQSQCCTTVQVEQCRMTRATKGQKWGGRDGRGGGWGRQKERGEKT